MDCLVLDHKKERLRLANQLGYWNCQRPNDIATKHECAMIALRMKKKYVPDIPDEMIWNKKDKNANVTL